MMRFEIFRTAEWYFRIVAKNGRTVCQSEAYKNKRDCVKTVKAIQVKAADAQIVYMDEPGEVKTNES